VTTALITALTWAAFLALFFYRNMRDQHLNYMAGRSFRAWIAARMSAILNDPEATPLALRFADFLLSLAYDRSRLRGIARQAAPHPQAVTFPAGELGTHARAIKVAVQYATVLALLEKRNLGNGMRKFLSEDSTAALNAVARVPFSATGVAGPQADPEQAPEAVTGFVHSPPGRAYEYAIEGQAMACAA
jgi:hypothetical protein